jgi:flagellar biosynthesis protein FlhF
MSALAYDKRTPLGPSRTFRGADARGALAAVKSALGPDAIILSTREVGGGLFRNTEVEVTAALEEPVPRPPSAQPMVRSQPSQMRAVAPPSNRGPTIPTSWFLDPNEDEHHESPAAQNSEAMVSRQLLERLYDLGFSRSLAKALVQRAMALGAWDAGALERSVRSLIATKLQSTVPPWKVDRRRVAALVGPTGVGKTTTIGKLTARALIDSRLKVALITIDTYRIAASDQLARYGDIMKVPTFVAGDAAQLARALERTAGADLVLIDTAGRSTEGEVMKQARLLSTVPGIELILTMSLTAGVRDLEATADRYRPLNPDRIILTKVDEAVAPGGFLSAATRLGRPVTCMTNGQRVPEDLHGVTSAQLVDIVMGSLNTTEWLPAAANERY